MLPGSQTRDLAEVKMGHYHCTTFSFGDGIIFAHYFQVLFSLPFKNIHKRAQGRNRTHHLTAERTQAIPVELALWWCWNEHAILYIWNDISWPRGGTQLVDLLRHGSKPRAGVMTLARWATWRTKLAARTFFFLFNL